MEPSATCCGCWNGILNGLKRPSIRRRGRHYRRARYNEREYSIEFENLIEEDDFKASSGGPLTEHERSLLSQGKFDALVEHQKKLDAAIDAELFKQEDDLRLEEEAYYQAKKEAAKVANHSKAKQVEKASAQSKRTFDSEEFSQWLSAENLNIASPELDVEDFDSFLEKVKARSLSAKTMKLIEEESDVDRQSSWEDTLNQGLEATKIAGEATSALGPADDYERGDMKDQTKNGTNKVSEDILRPLDEDDDDTFEDLL